MRIAQKLVECYFRSTDLYGAETWTPQRVDQKYLESFKMWCWIRLEKTNCTDRVRNKELLKKKSEGEEYNTYNKQKEG